ncbi:hypothetical protein MASR1M45_17710 [Candidatus Kapaibacterium sp.]
MKVLLIDCISEKLNIDTYKAVDKLIEGLSKFNLEIQKVKVHDLDIKPCYGCTSQSSFSYDTKCRCDDDMNNLYPLFRESEIWIFATHINTNGSTEYLKNLLDRLEPLFQPAYIYDNVNSGIPDIKTNGKIMMISSYEIEAAGIARNISEYIDSLGLLFSKDIAENILFDANRLDNTRLEMIYNAGLKLGEYSGN